MIQLKFLKMNKILYSLLLVLFFSTNYAQKNNSEDIYIYIDNQYFIGDVLGYKAFFFMPSEDVRFKSDNYYFKIDFGGLDYKSLYSLSKPIDIDTINIITPKEYFKKKSNCEVHTELSLYKRIYVVTTIPESKLKKAVDKTKKYIVWETTYAGTLKNYIYTNPTNKILLED